MRGLRGAAPALVRAWRQGRVRHVIPQVPRAAALSETSRAGLRRRARAAGPRGGAARSCGARTPQRCASRLRCAGTSSAGGTRGSARRQARCRPACGAGRRAAPSPRALQASPGIAGGSGCSAGRGRRGGRDIMLMTRGLGSCRFASAEPSPARLETLGPRRSSPSAWQRASRSGARARPRRRPPPPSARAPSAGPPRPRPSTTPSSRPSRPSAGSTPPACARRCVSRPNKRAVALPSRASCRLACMQDALERAGRRCMRCRGDPGAVLVAACDPAATTLRPAQHCLVWESPTQAACAAGN